ncbi:hypothetical protein I4U23_024228 [Adineta vaga]|nr:hypothetical protein I4U23_024228 [Adineta vaga]
MSMYMKDQSNKCQQSLNNMQDDNKAAEIQKIESQQRLIIQRMIRVEMQKEKLKHLLDVLQSLDSDADQIS